MEDPGAWRDSSTIGGALWGASGPRHYKLHIDERSSSQTNGAGIIVVSREARTMYLLQPSAAARPTCTPRGEVLRQRMRRSGRLVLANHCW